MAGLEEYPSRREAITRGRGMGWPGVMAKVPADKDLFESNMIRDLCAGLDLPFAPPDFAKRLNVAQGAKLTAPQLTLLRERLVPIYQDLSHRIGADRSKVWRWEGWRFGARLAFDIQPLCHLYAAGFGCDPGAPPGAGR